MTASFGYGDVIPVLKLGRLRFLSIGLALYLLGALLAASSGVPLYLDRLGIGYLILVTGHLSMHYSNDLFDYEADLRTMPNAVSGGSGILREHPYLKAAALYLALSLALLSVLVGTAFTWYYSYPYTYLGLVIFANLLGWFYAAPPARLSYRGLGEIATVLGVGVLMPLAGVLSTAGNLTPGFVAFLPAVLLYSTSFIVSVELPDLEADLAGNKRTFVARTGRTTGFAVIACVNLLATLYLLFLSVTTGAAIYTLTGILSILPLAVGFFGLLRTPSGRSEATRFAMASVGGFMFFLAATDACLAILLLT